jgi:hypothetical protein
MHGGIHGTGSGSNLLFAFALHTAWCFVGVHATSEDDSIRRAQPIIGVVLACVGAAYWFWKLRRRWRLQRLAVLVPSRDEWLAAPQTAHSWARHASIQANSHLRMAGDLVAAGFKALGTQWPPVQQHRDEPQRTSAPVAPASLGSVDAIFTHAHQLLNNVVEPARIALPEDGTPLDVGLGLPGNGAPVSWVPWRTAPWMRDPVHMALRIGYVGSGLHWRYSRAKDVEVSLTFHPCATPHQGHAPLGQSTQGMLCEVTGQGRDWWGAFWLSGGYIVHPLRALQPDIAAEGDALVVYLLWRYNAARRGDAHPWRPAVRVWTGVCFMPAQPLQAHSRLTSACNVLFGRWHLMDGTHPESGDWAALPAHPPQADAAGNPVPMVPGSAQPVPAGPGPASTIMNAGATALPVV